MLQFLVDKTNSLSIQGIYWFSYLVLYNHIQKTFWTIKFQQYLPNRFPANIKKGITYILGAATVAIAYYLVSEISKDLTKLV